MALNPEATLAQRALAEPQLQEVLGAAFQGPEAKTAVASPDRVVPSPEPEAKVAAGLPDLAVPSPEREAMAAVGLVLPRAAGPPVVHPARVELQPDLAVAPRVELPALEAALRSTRARQAARA